MKKFLLILFATSIVFSQSTPDLTEKQRYLNGKVEGSTPYRGINIKPIWELGYHGQDIHVADVQYDWDLDHEDLIDKNIEAYHDNVNAQQQQHGTNAIGIIGAVNNGFGMTGIAYSCEMSVWDIYDEMLGDATWGRSIRDAADLLNPGDIIQLEVSLATPSSPPLPAEINPLLHNAIKYAVSKGIIVLQAAGNGNTNLNNVNEMPYDDNGSIMVGNGSLTQVRMKTNSYISGSNYGDRVDVQAWGDTVVATLGTYNYSGVTPIEGFHGVTFGNSDHRAYTYQFSGTSSALPIVTGVVAVIQSFAKDSLGYTLTSQEMRDLLIRSGHPQDSSVVSGHIGPIPDAERAIKILTGDTLNVNISKTFITYNNNPIRINNNEIVASKNDKNIKFDIIDFKGQKIQTVNLNGNERFDLETLKLAKGFYFVSLKNSKIKKSLKWCYK